MLLLQCGLLLEWNQLLLLRRWVIFVRPRNIVHIVLTRKLPAELGSNFLRLVLFRYLPAELGAILVLLVLHRQVPAELGANFVLLVLCRLLPAELGSILVQLMPLRTDVKWGRNGLHNNLSVGVLLQRK